MGYKDGRTLKKYYCIKCGNKIHLNTALYKSKKCKSCIGKERKVKITTRKKISKTIMGHIGYFKGKHHTEEAKKKISLKHIGKIVKKSTKLKLRNINLGKKQSQLTIQKREQKINRHHIDLDRENNKINNILLLPKGKHIKLHYSGYRYLVETNQVKKYIKWFDKKYGLK